MAKKMKNLTPKELKFCSDYISTGSPQEAAKLAGYNCKNDAAFAKQGWEVMQRPRVQVELERLRDKERKRAAITMADLTDNFIRLANKGEELGQLPVSVKCNELLGKHLGYFEKDNKREYSHTIKSLKDASDDELMNILNQ
jgi:phage terminase small subunit